MKFFQYFSVTVCPKSEVGPLQLLGWLVFGQVNPGLVGQGHAPDMTTSPTPGSDPNGGVNPVFCNMMPELSAGNL